MNNKLVMTMFNQFLLGIYDCPDCKSIKLDTVVHVPKQVNEVKQVVTIVCKDCHWNTAAL